MVLICNIKKIISFEEIKTKYTFLPSNKIHNEELEKFINKLS